MLNLSDKDLDRLSQEAAQQHEPGDIVGPKFWDKLEARLDRDLGKMNPNPARGIRRLPYYYAPAVLVLLGVTYYIVRLNTRSQNNTSSTSPPMTMIKPAPAEPLKPTSLSPNPVPSDKSNSTPTASSNTVQYPGTAATGSNAVSPASAGTTANAPAGTTANAPAGAPHSDAASVSPHANAPAAVRHPNAPGATSPGATSNLSLSSSNSHTSSPLNHRRRNQDNFRTAATNTTASNTIAPNATAPNSASPGTTTPTTGIPSVPSTAVAPNASRAPHDLTFSAVRGPVRSNRKPRVDDAALLAVNPDNIREPIHHHGLRVNRSLTFGLLVAPDYASVNSLSGQKPGSTFGLTADYQFANHWYIGSGLLLSRKIFAAAPQDYHTPPNYYRNDLGVMGNTEADYVKGSFTMLEVPINLRYDFNTGGNLLFFVNAGVSSYFFTRESCGYYFTWYNTPYVVDKQKTYTNHPDNLFESLNLSLGAELGISNSLSIMLAPYYKIPIRNLGFGQIQLSSVGINFAVRFAPVISRKRF